MSFTILYPVVVLFALLIVFVIAFKIKGWKTAFLATGVTFVFFVLLFMALIFMIVNSM